MSLESYIVFLFLSIPFIVSGLHYLFSREVYKDISGAKEDGFLRRFNGAIIEYFREEENIHRIVLEAPEYSGNFSDPKFNFKEIRGLRRTVLYQIPVHNDPVPVFKFYKEEIETAGFTILFSDYGNQNLGFPRDWYEQILITGKNMPAWSDLASILQGNLLCYFSGEKQEGEGMVYISVFAVNHFRNNKRTGVFIFTTKDPVEGFHVSRKNP